MTPLYISQFQSVITEIRASYFNFEIILKIIFLLKRKNFFRLTYSSYTENYVRRS